MGRVTNARDPSRLCILDDRWAETIYLYFDPDEE